MKQINEFWRKDGRTIIVGQTGSGKSVMAKQLLLSTELWPVVIVDTKHEIELDDKSFPIAQTMVEVKRLLNRKVHGIRVRPSPEDLNEVEYYNELFKIIYDHKNVRLWIDELLGCVRGPTSFPYYLKALYTQGRSRGCGILACTQRPSGVPLFTLTESDVYLKFRLRMQVDQKRMSEMMGNSVLEPKDYPKSSVHNDVHSFYAMKNGSEPVEHIIKMEADR